MTVANSLIRKIWRIYVSDKHPFLRLLYSNILAVLKGHYARIKYRGLKKAPTLENLVSNTKYFTRIYGLRQQKYNEGIYNYSQNRDSVNDEYFLFKEYLPLWHVAAIDFLKNNLPKDAELLDICCGLGHFFIFLKELGFHKFTGVDDSIFQPFIIKAAKSFLSYYKIECHLYDFNVSSPSKYGELFKDKFDVVTYFNVGSHYLFEIAYNILKPNGYFILETVEQSWQGVWTEEFELAGLYEGFGRSKGNTDKSIHQYNTMVLRKKER